MIASLDRMKKRKRFSCRRFYAAFIEPSVTSLLKPVGYVCSLIGHIRIYCTARLCSFSVYFEPLKSKL